MEKHSFIMEGAPLVTVIITAYNSERFISKAIQSILDQSYANLEILICDDASTDNTWSIITEFSNKDHRIKAYKNQTNQWAYKNWNYLTSLAKGKYICTQDSDDWSHIHRVEKLVHVLEAEPNIYLVGSNIAHVDINGNHITSTNYILDPLELKNLLLSNLKSSLSTFSFPFCAGIGMFRKDVLNYVGGYRMFFDRLTWGDVDWVFRVVEKFQAKNIGDVLYYYRQNPSSITRFTDDYSIDRHIAKPAGIFLARQRLLHGSDGLENPALKEDFLLYLESLRTPFKENPSKIFRIMALMALANKNNKDALRLIEKAFLKRPSILNLKTLIKIGIKTLQK